MKLLRVLTDKGTEYCGLKESYPFQLFLHLNDIEHSKTRARHPQSNGCTEKLNQTILDEFYKVAFRKTLYTSLEQLQVDLDAFMKRYNEERTNQGKRCQGKTPFQTFLENAKLYFHYVHTEYAVEGASTNPVKTSENESEIQRGLLPAGSPPQESEGGQESVELNIF